MPDAFENRFDYFVRRVPMNLHTLPLNNYALSTSQMALLKKG